MSKKQELEQTGRGVCLKAPKPLDSEVPRGRSAASATPLANAETDGGAAVKRLLASRNGAHALADIENELPVGGCAILVNCRLPAPDSDSSIDAGRPGGGCDV